MGRRGAYLLPMLLASGCDSCNEERPYTPFGVASSAAISASAPSAPASTGPRNGDAASFRPAALRRAPPRASLWKIAGLALEAPPDRRFSTGLVADFDGDGRRDVVAWTLPRGDAATTAAHGELWFYRPRGDTSELARKKIAQSPGFVPSGPGCTVDAELAQTGPRSVTLDVRARCSDPVIPRSPTRGVSVLAPANDAPRIIALRIADPAPGESLELGVESLDRDGDGRDDVRVTVAVAAEGRDKPATADLVWLDRAAGPSRDATQPARSLTDLGSLEVVRAKGKNTSRAVLMRVDDARRLYASLCAESGTARVFDEDGEPLACGDLDRAFVWLATAELRAALTQHDVIRAFSVLGRDGWYHAELPPKERRKLEQELIGAVVEREVEAPRVVNVTPRSRGSTPRWSPLTFDSAGDLLVLTARSVARADLGSLEVEDASEEVDPWPVTVIGGDESQWSGIGLSCDRSEVVLLTTDANGTPNPADPIGLLSPRPGSCKTPGAGPHPEAIPVEWTGARRIGLIAGYPFGREGRLSATVSRGSPRSPDGRHLVVVTPLGLLVTGSKKPELWRGSVLGRPESLRECVIATGARAVACVRDQRVLLIRPAS